MKRAIFLLSLALCLVCFAEKDKDERNEPLRIGKEDSVQSEGVKIRVLKDAQMRPMPSVGSAGYRYKKDTKEKICDVFKARDLWFASQCVAMWECKDAKIYLAQPSLSPPKGDEMVSMEEYKLWKNSAKLAEDGSETAAWLAALADASLDGEPVPLKGATTGVEVKAYPLKGADANIKFAYLAANQRNREQTYAVIYELKDARDGDKNGKKVIEQSAASISFFKAKEGAETPKQLNAGDASKQKKEWSDNYIHSREMVLENLKNLKGWWYIETENFIIASNMTKRAAIASVQNMVEANRAVYAKLFPPLRPFDGVSVVRVFNKRDEYLDYVPKAVSFSAGLWMSDKKELAVSSTEEWAKGAKGTEMMLGILAHEGFHQYLHFASGETEAPPWFNEGTAKVFDNLKTKPGGKFEIDIPDYVYDHMKEAMKSSSANLQKLLKMDYEEFYEKAYIDNNYACACAFMYFLYKGAPLMKGKERYGEIPGRFYKTLCETKSAKKAGSDAFEGVDLKELEKDWKDFWDGKSLYNRSKSAEFKPVIAAPAPLAADAKRP